MTIQKNNRNLPVKNYVGETDNPQQTNMENSQKNTTPFSAFSRLSTALLFLSIAFFLSHCGSKPSVSIDSKAGINLSNYKTYVVNGSCSEDGGSVEVKISGSGKSLDLTPPCSGNWETIVDTTGMGDGKITVSATHESKDQFGKSQTAKANQDLFKDTTVPVINITNSSAITAANVTNYAVSGGCSETGKITVNVGGIKAETICAVGSTANNSAWIVKLDVSKVKDGPTVLITADITDTVGNNAIQAKNTVSKNVSTVTVTLADPKPIYVANAGAYPINGTCSENGNAVTANIGGTEFNENCTGGIWNMTKDVSTLNDGTIDIKVNHKDSAGNAAPSVSKSTTKDTKLPAVAITNAPAITGGNAASYAVSGTCSENNNTVTVNFTGSSGSKTPTTQPSCTSGTWSLTDFNVSTLSNGNITITADHIDNAGNPATKASMVIQKAVDIPTVAIVNPPSILVINKNNYGINGTCSVSGQPVTVNIGGKAPATQPTCASGKWSLTGFDAGTISAEGKDAVAITADHKDASGNQAKQSIKNVTKDTGVPTVSIGIAADIRAANVSKYTMLGGCSENGRTVTVMIGTLAPAAQPICTNNLWTMQETDVSSLADGDVTIKADLSDDAGNSAQTQNRIVNKNVPDVKITNPPEITGANAHAYAINGTCSENGQPVGLNINADGKNITANPTCTTQTWSATVNVTGMNKASSISMTANHKDTGNIAASPATKTAANKFICPTNYIGVPPLSDYTTNSFCVMTYEARAQKNDGSGYDADGCSTTTGCSNGDTLDRNDYKPASISDNLPWRNIGRDGAIAECQSLGTGYDLIINDEWLTLARNIELVPANWTGGSVGNSCLKQGNNGESDCGYDGTDPEGGAGRNSRAMFTLSNNEQIWDLAGNLWEWIKDDTGSTVYYPTDDVYMIDLIIAKPTATGSLKNDGKAGPVRNALGHFGPTNDYSVGADDDNNHRGLGWTWLDVNVGALSNGGSWRSYADSGVFAAALDVSATKIRNDFGFRCTYHP